MCEDTQQLERRSTPADAAPVPGSVAERLNRSERVASVLFSAKTFSNNSEEHLTQRWARDLRVPVLNMRGQPLMPTTPRKARKLLEQGKAKVVSRTPFVIQFLYPTGETKQPITLGVDAGYSVIGYSVVTDKSELMAGELKLRADISRLLAKRRAYRKERRSRKWHREPRFDNRVRSGRWLAPSLEHKLQSHLKLVERLKRILPITKIVVEVSSFDTQRIQNPEISGVEYQQGELAGYEVREYLLEKWRRRCAYCGKSDVPLEVEHITPKSRGGSNRVSNLTVSCRKCNQEKGDRTAEELGHPEVQSQAREPLRAAAFMTAIRWKMVNLLNCGWTFGGVTKYRRSMLRLAKSHVNDAFVIAGGSDQIRVGSIYRAGEVRRQNRSLFKANLLKCGKRKRNTVKEVNGFRRFDKVRFRDAECFIFGLRSSGYFELRDFDGRSLGASVNCASLSLLERAKGKIEEVTGQFLPTLTHGVSLPALR